MFFNFLETTAASAGKTGNMTMIIMLVVMFGAMYFLMLRPQKKRQKEEQEMRDNVQVGDEVVTIGGICGRVITVKDDDSIVVETGADRAKVRFKKWAIQQNITANEKLAAERAAAKEAAEKAKAEKKAQKSKKD